MPRPIKIFEQNSNNAYKHSNTLKARDFDVTKQQNIHLNPHVFAQSGSSHHKNKSSMNCLVSNERLTVSPGTIKQYYGQGPTIMN